jgi:CDP-glycerol glycerophosphotransferase (TagB/SpsB family)
MKLDFQTVIGVILRPLLFAIYFLSGFVPRSSRRWVFGCWSGKRFADNSAALIEHMHRLEQPLIKAVWISRDPAIIRKLRSRGFVAHAPWSVAGAFACITAGVYVFDGLTKDINHWLSRGAKRVLLRHGVGIKNIERAIEHPNHRLYQLFHGSPVQRLFWSYLLPWHRVHPDLIIATSPDHAVQGQLYFGVGAERVAITGFPRNDRLLATPVTSIDERIHALSVELKRRQLPAFLYLPTFRDDDSQFEFSLAELEQMAARLGIVLLVKLHFVDAQRNKIFVPAQNSHLRILDPSIDPNELFELAAGLISDYSSVVFDFILTGKPVIHFVPDLEQYLSHSRSFYYDFESITPGPRTKSVEELERTVRLMMNQGLGEWEPRYEEILSKFHTYRDAGSCERTCQAIVGRFLPCDPGLTSSVLTESTVE